VELLEDGTLQTRTDRRLDLFEAEGVFVRTATPPARRCAEDGGVRWCGGEPLQGGLWRMENGQERFAAYTPRFSGLDIVRGGVLLTGPGGDFFVADTRGELSEPVRLRGEPNEVSAAAWSTLARPTTTGRIELVPLEGVPLAEPAPFAPPAPKREPGQGPGMSLVIAIEGASTFNSEMPLARQLAFELLDSLERAYTPQDQVGLVTFHHRRAQIRSPLVPLAEEAETTKLRARLSQFEVARRWFSPHAPREYPDETGSDPSVGLAAAMSLLEGVEGRRVIWLVTESGAELGPGLLRQQQGYVETRWPEVSNESHADEASVLGIEVWVLAIQDQRSCTYARPTDRCVFTTTPELLQDGRGLVARIR
jgi:hypothetical protein